MAKISSNVEKEILEKIILNLKSSKFEYFDVAELKALNAALLFAEQYISNGTDKVIIKTDSKYSISCLTEWIDSWIAKDWKNSKREPVKNKEIIQPMCQIPHE